MKAIGVAQRGADVGEEERHVPPHGAGAGQVDERSRYELVLLDKMERLSATACSR